MRAVIYPILAFAAAGCAGAAAASPAGSTGDFGLVVQSHAMTAPTLSDLGRGRTALARGEFGRARLLLAPLADGSLDPDLLLLAGYADLGAGRTEVARRRFERTLRLDRSSAFARHGLALASLVMGDRAAAASQLSALEQARTRCAGRCSAAARLDDAAASLRRALGRT